MKSVFKNLVVSCFIILCTISCQMQADNSNSNSNQNNHDHDQPIIQSFLSLSPFNFESIIVGKTVYGTVQSASVASDDIIVHISTDNNSILQSSCVIPKGKSTCTFKITGHAEGSSILYASAIGYKGDQSKTIKVIDIDQLSITSQDNPAIVGNAVYGTVIIPNKNLDSNPINIAIQSNASTIIKDGLCLIQPGESKCDFKLDTLQLTGTTEIKAFSDNYKASFPKTITVIDKTQLTIEISTTILNVHETISGYVKIPTPTAIEIPVTINSSTKSTMENSGCKIQPKQNSCTFTLIASAEGNTDITASEPNYKPSEPKSLKVLDKFQLSVAEFEAHTIGLNACLPINITSTVGFEKDVTVAVKDTNDTIPSYYSYICTIKKGMDHCSANLCSKATAGEVKIEVSAPNYKVILPEDISLNVVETKKISTDPIIGPDMVMAVGEVKPITITVQTPAEANTTIGILNTGPGSGGFTGSNCTIYKDTTNCTLNLIASDAGNRSVTLTTDKLYSGLDLGNITVTNSLILEVANPQFTINQENTITIKLPVGAPNVKYDAIFHLTTLDHDIDLSNYYCTMQKDTNTCTMKTKAQKTGDARIFASQSVNYPDSADYGDSNYVHVSVK